MKKIFLLILLCSLTPVYAQNQTVNEAERREQKLLLTMEKYPDPVASFGRHKFSRIVVAKWVIAAHPDFEDYTFEELTDIIEQTVDEKIYFTLISEFLSAEGFPPSQKDTLKYLQQSVKKFPPALRKLKYRDDALHSLAADSDRQLSVALQNYLKKKRPSEITVNDDEVEYFYRINQNAFVHDAKIDIGFIAVDKKAPDALKTINKAHAMLMQGVLFEKLASEINSKLPEKFFGINQFPPEIAAHAAQMEVNIPSDVLEFPNYYAIIRIEQKKEPSYIPLENAAFFIRNELESRKSGIYLEKLLSELLEKYPVKR